MKNFIVKILILALLFNFTGAGLSAYAQAKPPQEKTETGKRKKSFIKQFLIGTATVVGMATAIYYIVKIINKDGNVTTLVNRVEVAQIDQLTFSGMTPGGVKYRARSKVSAEVEAAIDEGFRRMALVAAHYNYRNKIGIEHHVLLLIPEEALSIEGYYPSITAPLNCKATVTMPGGYCGSIYDKGAMPLNDRYLFDPAGKVKNKDLHYLLAAEKVIVSTLGKNEQFGAVVLPKIESARNPDLVMRGTMYFLEHTFKYNNDRPRYDRTVGNGNDIHPDLLLPGVND